MPKLKGISPRVIEIILGWAKILASREDIVWTKWDSNICATLIEVRDRIYHEKYLKTKKKKL